MRAMAQTEPAPTTDPSWSFLWLEITGRCQLSCTHCYAESGPTGLHSALSRREWQTVITDASKAGIRMVQFIGGEPTTHPDFADLVAHAIANGLAVEVYTNLVRVNLSWWELFSCPQVSLATSYYSDQSSQHDIITRRKGSHARTRSNIMEAVRRGIPLRVGLVDLDDAQRVDQARAELRSMGVQNIGTDRLRQVGRGSTSTEKDTTQLCGNCARGVAAVSGDGDVWPCVFARWMPVGNVRDTPLADILNGPVMAATSSRLAECFGRGCPCVPKMCDPQCGPSCSPACRPANNCIPVGTCVPSYE